MKLWVDDIREPPDHSWTWAQTSAAALWHLKGWQASPDEVLLTLALDHDLGLTEEDGRTIQDTTRPVVIWLIENDVRPWIYEITVHTSNPPGREWLEGMIRRYLGDCHE